MTPKYIMESGWLPSPADERDYPMLALALGAVDAPKEASLESFVSHIDDQLTKPWCVGFGIANAVEFYLKRAGLPVPEGGFSKAWLYAMCKQNDGIPEQDGTYIRTAFMIAQKYGLCPDSLCPTEYWLKQGTLPVLTVQMATEAAKYKVKTYARLYGIEQIKQAIAAGQFVVVGSWVEQQNWLDGDELILEPEGTILGGHCTFHCAYSDILERASHKGFNTGINSWGKEWGNQGKYLMSYDYMNWHDDIGMTAFQEAWTFTCEGAKPMKTIKMTGPMKIEDGRTLLPFRSVYEALGANVNWYRNAAGKIVAIAEVELKGKTVIVETTQDSDDLIIYEK